MRLGVDKLIIFVESLYTSTPPPCSKKPSFYHQDTLVTFSAHAAADSHLTLFG
jgi:hypothetical protein